MFLGAAIITVGVIGTFSAITGTTPAVIAALFAPTNNLTDHTGSSAGSRSGVVPGLLSPAIALGNIIQDVL